MSISLTSSLDVFLFIIFCSIYVCSTLWIYGDAATRGTGWKGLLLPLLFIVAGTLALVLGMYAGLFVWPLAYVGWFLWRPPPGRPLIKIRLYQRQKGRSARATL